jgi:hypothetical protein
VIARIDTAEDGGAPSPAPLRSSISESTNDYLPVGLPITPFTSQFIP